MLKTIQQSVVLHVGGQDDYNEEPFQTEIMCVIRSTNGNFENLSISISEEEGRGLSTINLHKKESINSLIEILQTVRDTIEGI